MVHTIIRWIGQRALRWFYRERRFIGGERIPASGPVLFIGNHRNDIPDVLCGFMMTPRRLRYVGTISAATSAPAKAAYSGLGVIPVARARDARKLRQQQIDGSALNLEAFQRVGDALAAGDIVGIFPEGGVHDGPSLGVFRSGVAKMALDGIVSGAINRLTVIAFGVQYDAPRTPRSDLSVLVGEPFVVDTDSPAVLRERMRDALLAVTRNAPSWEVALERDRIVAAIAASITGPGDLRLTACEIQQRCSAIAEAAPTNIGALAADLSATVDRAGGMPVSPRDCARVIATAEEGEADGVRASAAAEWPSWLAVVAATPFAVLGWITHGPIFSFIWRRASATKDPTEIAARAMIPGLYLIFGWYVLLGALFMVGLGATAHAVWWGVPAVMLLPRLGDVAVWWRDAVRAMRLRGRVRRWPEQERAAVRTTARALRAAWHSHLSSVAVKALT